MLLQLIQLMLAAATGVAVAIIGAWNIFGRLPQKNNIARSGFQPPTTILIFLCLAFQKITLNQFL